MEIFNKIGDTITSKSKDVAKKAKDLAEVTQLNSQLSGQKNALESYMTQLGKAYFAKYESNYDAQFSEIIEAIRTTQGNIEGIEKQIKTIKGMDKCTNCGSDIPSSVLFCSTCGTKNENYQAAPVVKACVKCNFTLNEDTVFCPNCGNKA